MDRVTTHGRTANLQDWIKISSSRLDGFQEQVATGVRLRVGSDSPSDANTLLRNQRTLQRMEQLDRNLSNARLWLDAGDRALNEIVAAGTQARTLAIQGANDTNTPESRAAIAADIRSIAQQVTTLANTTVNGRAIFAGTAGTAQAYDDAGAYLGDGGQVVRTVTPSDSFSVASSGPVAFGTENPGDPYNGTILQVLNRVADAVEAGDVAATRLGIEAIDTAMGRVTAEVGRIGNMAKRIDEIQNRNEADKISTRTRISDARDVDIGEALIRLRSAETAYQATLSAAARSLGPSLLDFLR